MKTMKREYIEGIYAGWLAKMIGVRHGAPTEGWTYEKIERVLGEIHDYPMDYKQFAADDDTNGPMFFIRALEDSKEGIHISPQDVGEALLNYACYEQGFFWWGGYGKSTEHTAYQNLRAGITAPQSGSADLNGDAVAEAIGGQIFIDTWGLVNPGNPDLAASYAKKAASVTHDKNGIYGGMFIASCIAYAFDEKDIYKVIKKGLSYLPDDCEYMRMARGVIGFYEEHPENWRDGFHYVQQYFGYDRYPGNCHIIPNSAVIILSLLYGKGDFDDTINICNMCGWDTDCNVGNAATIVGVLGGLDKIADKWRVPINDIQICSSVMGAMNIIDIPYAASYLAKLATRIAGQILPEPYYSAIERKIDNCHFEYPGSTHGIRVRLANQERVEAYLKNTDEDAKCGERSLRVSFQGTISDRVLIYKKTYYVPSDFDDSRYDPSFSPVIYGGQKIEGSLKLCEGAVPCKAHAYVHNAATDEILTIGEGVSLSEEEWTKVTLEIPHIEGEILDEAGFVLDLEQPDGAYASMSVLLDEFCIEGEPDYSVDFKKSNMEYWHILRKEVSQFTTMKGHSWIDQDRFVLSCSDFGEAYTGGYDWKDYEAVFDLRPEFGEWHMVNVRVQGAIRSYAVGFSGSGRFGLYKNENGYAVLKEIKYDWRKEQNYQIKVRVFENTLTVSLEGEEIFSYTDDDHPYLYGSVGYSVRNGSRLSSSGIRIQGNTP